MKKFLTTILILLYVTATTGATVHLHYCMGEVRSWKLWHAPKRDGKCHVCGMTNKKGCCEDRHVVIKAEKKHSVPTMPDWNLKPPAILSFPVYNQYPSLIPVSVSKYSFSSGSPPGNTGVPLFIRYCMYRI